MTKNSEGPTLAIVRPYGSHGHYIDRLVGFEEDPEGCGLRLPKYQPRTFDDPINHHGRLKRSAAKLTGDYPLQADHSLILPYQQKFVPTVYTVGIENGAETHLQFLPATDIDLFSLAPGVASILLGDHLLGYPPSSTDTEKHDLERRVLLAEAVNNLARADLRIEDLPTERRSFFADTLQQAFSGYLQKAFPQEFWEEIRKPLQSMFDLQKKAAGENGLGLRLKAAHANKHLKGIADERARKLLSLYVANMNDAQLTETEAQRVQSIVLKAANAHGRNKQNPSEIDIKDVLIAILTGELTALPR